MLKHPIVLIVPILMLLDYYLTLIGAYLYKRTSGQYIKTKSYELNPVFQKAIAAGKLFNIQHLLAVTVVTTALTILSETDQIATGFGQFLLGLLIVMFSALNGRHIANILTFSYILYNPELLSGEIYYDHLLTLKISQNQLFFLLFPLLAVAFIHPMPFSLGGVASIFVLMIYHVMWITKYKYAMQPTEKTEWETKSTDEHII